MTRRSYSGNAKATTLLSGIDSSATTINLVSGTGYPAGGAAGPFYIVIDRGLTSEEKILCDSTAVNTITVNASGRGADGTPASAHALGAVVEHCWTATDADEANAHVNDITTDVHPQYTTTAELSTHSSAADPHTAYLTAAEVNALIAAAAVPAVPVGGVTQYAGSAAPSNWLLCNGATVSQATYPDLFAVTGHTFGADPGGGNFILPDYRDRVPVGVSGTKARGVIGGAADAALPTHSHTVTSHSHGGVTGGQSVTHTHGPGGGLNSFITFDGSTLEAQGAAGSVDPRGWQTTTSTGNASVGHTHSVAAEAPGTNAQGVSPTGLNLPPYQAINYIIRAL